MLPTPLVWAMLALLALAFGSFLNVCISRLPLHRSIAWPGSHCPRCRAPIEARDNLPLVSWLLLRGRCRHCGQPISLRYPLVEVGYLGLVLACVARFGLTVEALAGSVFCWLALGLLVTDLETMLLPDSLTLPGILLGLLWAADAEVSTGRASLATPRSAIVAAGIAALASAGSALLLLVIRWIYYGLRRRQGLGLGDVKLVAMLAAWLGAPGMALCFVLAVIGAAAVGVLALLSGKKASSGGWGSLRLPLGAFLCAAGVYVLFFGAQTLKWYFSFWL